jgi:biotin carboxylase
MRIHAHAGGVPVPEFVPVVHYDTIRTFMERVAAPWILKPRSEASSIGMARIQHPDELWPRLEALGDRQSFFLLERFVSGNVYHLDGLVVDGKIRFAEAHQYGRPPMEVFHEGGIAMSRPMARGSDDEEALQQLGKRVIAALGLERGATHMEFIKGEDDQFYFLEAAARVGGASTAETVEAATGINLWAEWARIELTKGAHDYRLPKRRNDYAGIILSLARQEEPDTSAYTDPEIVWRLAKPQHVGFIVCSPDPSRVNSLLDEYSRRFQDDFFAALPPWEARPPSHT